MPGDAARCRTAIWLPGLAVAVGAAVATAHGLYEVAVAARVPAGIAWLYPLITDGLALVAYAATARLDGSAPATPGRSSCSPPGCPGSRRRATSPAASNGRTRPLRFGVGAWPAVAAAVVAHLLYLLAAGRRRPYSPRPSVRPSDRRTPSDPAPATARPTPRRATAPGPPRSATRTSTATSPPSRSS